MPAEFLVNVVKINKEDSDSPGEILCEKKDEVREEVRRLRLKGSPNTVQKAAGDRERPDRTILKITPWIDQRIWNTKKSG